MGGHATARAHPGRSPATATGRKGAGGGRRAAAAVETRKRGRMAEEEEAKKAGPKAVEITKKFEQAYIDRDYDAMLEMLTDDIKAALPFRCAPLRA